MTPVTIALVWYALTMAAFAVASCGEKPPVRLTFADTNYRVALGILVFSWMFVAIAVTL